MGLTVIVKPSDPDFYADTRWERNAHGAVMVDGQEVACTMQCPHCGGHFVSRRGSGTRRTFCMNCNAVTCGNPNCDPCIPWEKTMLRIEKEAAEALRRL